MAPQTRKAAASKAKPGKSKTVTTQRTKVTKTAKAKAVRRPAVPEGEAAQLETAADGLAEAAPPPPEEPRAIVAVRTMELEDMPRVFALGEKLFTAEKWPVLYRTWDEYEIVELFASDGEYCLVAETDDEGSPPDTVVGFALGALIEKRHSAWSYGYLLWMGVDPDLKGRGVGRRMLQVLTDRFLEAGARMMLVDTAADNEGALAFFRGQGFGHELGHVYLTRNLAQEAKAKKARRAAQRRPARGARNAPQMTEIVTPSVLEPPAPPQP